MIINNRVKVEASFGGDVQCPKEGIDVDELAARWTRGDGDGWGRTITGYRPEPVNPNLILESFKIFCSTFGCHSK